MWGRYSGCKWGKEIEPEPFAENAGPKTLDLTRGAGLGFVGEEKRVKTVTVADRSGWGLQMPQAGGR